MINLFKKNKKDNSEVIPLFSVPLYQNTVENYDNKFDSEQCNTIEYDRFNLNNGHVSTDRNIINQHCFSDLKKVVDNEIKSYLHGKLGISVLFEHKFTSSWIMCHENGDFAQRHLHTNSMFSGIFYINVPDKSGDVVFHIPPNMNTVFTPTLRPTLVENNIFTTQVYTITPENGMILLFPSHLLHSVTANISGKLRHCLVFNLFLYGEYGDRETNNILNLNAG